MDLTAVDVPDGTASLAMTDGTAAAGAGELASQRAALAAAAAPTTPASCC
ncbi:hypothetical protein [Streptomyces longisporus]